MKKPRSRKPRPRGLIYTRCVVEDQIRAHTIALSKDGPMLRCQTCGAMRKVAQTTFPFAG